MAALPICASAYFVGASIRITPTLAFTLLRSTAQRMPLNYYASIARIAQRIHHGRCRSVNPMFAGMISSQVTNLSRNGLLFRNCIGEQIHYAMSKE